MARQTKLGSRMTLVYLLSVIVAVGFAMPRPLEKNADVVAKIRHVRQTSPELLQRSFNFGGLCSTGIQLTLGNKRLNIQNLRLTSADAIQIAPVLYGRPFEERMKILCQRAELSREMALKLGRDMSEVDIAEMGLFQGDILLSPETVDAMLNTGLPDRAVLETAELGPQQPQVQTQPGFRQRLARIPAFPSIPELPLPSQRFKRKIIASQFKHWENGVVPWRFANNLSNFKRQSILAGIASWEAKTCLTFPETPNPSGTFLNFINGNGCYSFIGKQSSFSQDVSIGNSCESLGIVVHEIGHAVGMQHEQSRPDRDSYVTINTQNIQSQYLSNFVKGSWNTFETRRAAFDLSAVMMYASKDFSVNGGVTLRPTRGDYIQGMGQRNDLSFYDVKVANFLYCSGKCPEKTLESPKCLNEGYLFPKDGCTRCVCPPGLALPDCSAPVTSPSVCGTTTFTADSTKRTFLSPGYTGGLRPKNVDCVYMFKAQDNRRVKVQFLGAFDVQKPGRACFAYVEIRDLNLAIGGPRFCGTNRPNGFYVSHGDTMLITYSTKSTSTQGFQMTYEAENCGGCSTSPLIQEPSCLRTTIFDCDVSSARRNRCFDLTLNSNKRYCCTGYKLQGTNCIRNAGETTTTTSTTTTSTTTTTTTTPTPTPTTATTTTSTTTTTEPPITTTETTPTPNPNIWGPWGEWSECRRNCGLCGRQFRRRTCLITQCNESSFQIQKCGTQVCKQTIRTRQCLLFPGQSCYSINTKPYCCAPARIEGDNCVL